MLLLVQLKQRPLLLQLLVETRKRAGGKPEAAKEEKKPAKEDSDDEEMVCVLLMFVNLLFQVSLDSALGFWLIRLNTIGNQCITHRLE